MKPLVSIWTSSQLTYDQRILRIKSVMESMGMKVVVWDRATPQYPDGRIRVKPTSGPSLYAALNREISRQASQQNVALHYAADIDVMPGLIVGLRKKKEIPLLLDLHEWFPEVVELTGRPVKKMIWEWIERRSIRRATSCMTVNVSLSKIFEEKYGRSFTVVRNVPELGIGGQVDVQQRLERKILYYQGALNEGRGLENVIRWMKLLPKWRLWLVGDGDIAENLRKLTDEEGLTDRVVFYGRQKPKDLPGLAAQATLGLNLLRGDSLSYYYSLANRYFDYIHNRLPAIHMDFPEYELLMKKYGIGQRLTNLSAEEFVDLVQEMTESVATYEEMVDQCELARIEYNWEKESDVLKSLLEQICK